MESTGNGDAAHTLFVGSVITMDPAQPRAEAVLVRDGRIAAVGGRDEVTALAPADASVVELGDRVLLPGFVEAHGHPMASAVMLSRFMCDIRPVTIPDADAVRAAMEQWIRTHPEGAYFLGWDPLLHKGLTKPTLRELDQWGGDTPIVIIHNSGHSAYFNSAAAVAVDLTADTPDPVGAHFVHDEDGNLTGEAVETGALLMVAAPVLASANAEYPDVLSTEFRRLNAAGITLTSEHAWQEIMAMGLAWTAQEKGQTVRIRSYEMTAPDTPATVAVDNGDDMYRQIGMKTWADGSPWIGNIATSFPYLNTPATEIMGLGHDHCGEANYSVDLLEEVSRQYVADGWQLSCHAHGDLAIDMVLDVWERLMAEHPRDDHRYRLEHVGAMTVEQFARAAKLGVTLSMFVDHVYYWGEVLTDDLFGPERGGRWVDVGGAVAAGHRVSLHNDGFVTPPEPLINIQTAMTRNTRNGSSLDIVEGISLDAALRAQTIDAAWQLFAEEIVGSVEVGKYADLVVLSADPYDVDPAQIGSVSVVETWLAGSRVFEKT